MIDGLKTLKDEIHRERVLNLRNIVRQWGKGGFVQTNDIEKDLHYVGEKLGVVIKRVDDYKNYLNKQKFESLFISEEETSTLTELELRDIIRKSSAVVGADGVRSVVSEVVMPKKSFEKTYQHNALLKYQAPGTQLRRSPKEVTTMVSEAGMFTKQSISRDTSKPIKPTTLNIFIDEETYQFLMKKDSTGKVVKGDAAHAYTVKELEIEANKHPGVKKLYDIVRLHLKDKNPQGEVLLSVLPLTMSQSEHSYAEFHGKPILKVGDANSTLILQRGFNKGLKEAAELAKTLSSASKNEVDSAKFYTQYEKKVQRIYNQERWMIEFKNSILNAIILVYKLIGRFFEVIFKPREWDTFEPLVVT